MTSCWLELLNAMCTEAALVEPTRVSILKSAYVLFGTSAPQPKSALSLGARNSPNLQYEREFYSNAITRKFSTSRLNASGCATASPLK